MNTFRRCRPLLCALAVALALPGGALRAQPNLPALGESASDDLDVVAERRLGERIMEQVRRDPAYLDDPVLLEYVQSLWSPLVAVARRNGQIGADVDGAFAWEAFLVRDRSVNAFALPGGHVGVHLGLIAMTAQREELAAVLAHELTHVTQRHIARSLGNAQRQGMVGMAAILLAILAASRAGNGDATQAAIVGGQAALVQGQLNYSRAMEREADRIGFGVLEGAGFDTRGMTSMFEKLALANRLNDSGAFPYLRSHPLTTERISEARERAAGAPTGSSTEAAALLHALMRARARVLMDPSAAALERLLQGPAGAETGDLPAALYTRALAALRLSDTEEARRQVRDLLQVVANAPADPVARRAAQRLAAEIELAAGAPDRAAAALTLAGAGDGRAGLLLRAQVALARARVDPDGVRRSAEALQVWTAEHPADAQAWRVQAQASEAAGLRLRALRAEAEASLAAGDLPGAVDRLRAAQRAARTAKESEQIEIQVIAARLRVLDRQLRERLEEARGMR